MSHLELVENQNDKGHTLFSILNHCTTSTGKRFLKQKILFPTRDPKKILSHWDKIEILSKSKKERSLIKQHLSEIVDLERILTRFRVWKSKPKRFSRDSKEHRKHPPYKINSRYNFIFIPSNTRFASKSPKKNGRTSFGR